MRPGVGTGVFLIKDDKFLLGRRIDPTGYGDGRFSLPGGHVEFGETLEQGAMREVFEETGYYPKIQPTLLGFCNTVASEHHKHYVTFFFSVLVTGEDYLRHPSCEELLKIDKWVWKPLDDTMWSEELQDEMWQPLSQFLKARRRHLDVMVPSVFAAGGLMFCPIITQANCQY